MHAPQHLFLLALVVLTAAFLAPRNQYPRNEEVSLLARQAYSVGCAGTGNTFPRCYEGRSAGCRCDSFETFLCEDTECRDNCGACKLSFFPS